MKRYFHIIKFSYITCYFIILAVLILYSCRKKNTDSNLLIFDTDLLCRHWVLSKKYYNNFTTPVNNLDTIEFVSFNNQNNYYWEINCKGQIVTSCEEGLWGFVVASGELKFKCYNFFGSSISYCSNWSVIALSDTILILKYKGKDIITKIFIPTN